jgi:hypothetical protein
MAGRGSVSESPDKTYDHGGVPQSSTAQYIPVGAAEALSPSPVTASQPRDLAEGIALLRAAFIDAQNGSMADCSDADDLPVLIISHQSAEELADQILSAFLAEFPIAALFDLNDEVGDSFADPCGLGAGSHDSYQSTAEMIRISSFCQRQGLSGTADNLMTLALRRQIFGVP